MALGHNLNFYSPKNLREFGTSLGLNFNLKLLSIFLLRGDLNLHLEILKIFCFAGSQPQLGNSQNILLHSDLNLNFNTLELFAISSRRTCNLQPKALCGYFCHGRLAPSYVWLKCHELFYALSNLQHRARVPLSTETHFVG